jgi:hypothetical protein
MMRGIYLGINVNTQPPGNLCKGDKGALNKDLGVEVSLMGVRGEENDTGFLRGNF